MSSKKRYLSLVVLAFAPYLHGCLWDSIHLDGTLDAKGGKEEVSPKGDDSLKSEENTNEDKIEK